MPILWIVYHTLKAAFLFLCAFCSSEQSQNMKQNSTFFLPKDKKFCWRLINRPMLLVVRKINAIEGCYLQSGTIMGPRQLYYRNHTQLSSTNIQKVLEDIWYMLSFFLKTIPLSQFIFKWGCGMIHIFSWLESGERKPLRHTFRKFIHI